MFALLLTAMLSQVAPPYRPVIGPYVPEQVVPDSAIRHTLANGETLAIVPEKLMYKTITTTSTMPSCGMGWCVTHPLVTTKQSRRVCENFPTPLPALESILRLAGVTKDDCLYDLGCGDGRVCVMASKLFNIFTIGLDIRPEAVKIADENARINGVDRLAAFYAFPFESQRLAHATVVYVYLKPDDIAKLRIPTNVRMGISYKHPWPGVNCEQIGDFYVWRRPPKTEKTAKVTPRRVFRLCPS